MILLILINIQGKIEVQGSPADLARSGVDFAKLVGVKEQPPNEENTEIDNRSRRSSVWSTISATSSITEELDEDVEDEEKDEGIQMEESSKGKVKGSILAAYFKAGAHWTVLFVLAFSFVFVQVLASAADVWVSVW